MNEGHIFVRGEYDVRYVDDHPELGGPGDGRRDAAVAIAVLLEQREAHRHGPRRSDGARAAGESMSERELSGWQQAFRPE